MTTHEAPGDAFWDKIRAGAQAAAAKDNMELKYSADPAPDKQATLIQNAVDSKVDGLATTMSAPDALSGAIKVATDAGIPVVGFNAGINDWKELGAIMYFGSDETIAGNAVGERLAAARCQAPDLRHPGGRAGRSSRPAARVSPTRCVGVENLQVNGRDATQVTSTIGAKLQADPSIDYVVTLGAQFAVNAIDAVGQANSSAKVVTFDLNADAAKLIKDGKILFAVDQQPYLQGYEAVDIVVAVPDQPQQPRRWAAGADRSRLRRRRQHRRHPSVHRGRHSLTFTAREAAGHDGRAARPEPS